MIDVRKFQPYLLSALTFGAVGLAFLLMSLGNPRFATLHTIDMLKLIAVGWCFGLAFGFVLMFLLTRKSGRPEDPEATEARAPRGPVGS
jgi:hypothetical protein